MPQTLRFHSLIFMTLVFLQSSLSTASAPETGPRNSKNTSQNPVVGYFKAKEKLDYMAHFRPDLKAEAEFQKHSDLLHLSPDRTQRYLQEVRQRANESLAREKASCESVDLRNDSLGPARSQSNIAWCAAFVAADLVSYKLGQRVSAADLALMRNNWTNTTGLSASRDAWINKFYKKVTGAESDLIGDFLDWAIRFTKPKGWCLESNFRSEDVSLNQPKKTIKSLLQETEALKAEVSQPGFDPSVRCSNCESASKVFPGLSQDVILQTVRQSPVESALPALATRACGSRIQDPSLEVVSSSRLFFDATSLGDIIDEQLNRSNIAGVLYDITAFYNRDYDKPLGWHSGSVVGRRFNNSTNECEYLVRNTWGSVCKKGYADPRYQCEEGHVWIPKLVLLRWAHDVTYIK